VEVGEGEEGMSGVSPETRASNAALLGGNGNIDDRPIALFALGTQATDKKSPLAGNSDHTTAAFAGEKRRRRAGRRGWNRRPEGPSA
jgi:hypothetical protein